MDNRKVILQSLEELKNRPDLKTPEEIAMFILAMPIPGELRAHLYQNLVQEGFVTAPLAATGGLAFSPEKAIKWVIREIKKEFGEET